MSDSPTALDHEPAAKRRCLDKTTKESTSKEPTEKEPGQEVADFHDEKEESKPLSKKKNLFGLQQLPRSVELEILEWLRHTGSFACTSRAANDLISRCQQANEGDDGQVCCCPSQQFHHPTEGELINVSELDDEPFDHPTDNRMKLERQEMEDEDDNDNSLMGLSRSAFKRKVAERDRKVAERDRKVAERDLRWSCCGSDLFSTGCMSNTDVAPEEAQTAMEANEEALSNAYEVDTCDSAYSNRDWDESYGGDAKLRLCGWGLFLLCVLKYRRYSTV
jgi:hypothetical protein